MSASQNPTAQWAGIIFCAILSITIGLSLGFFSQALLPVKTFTGTLPVDTPKKKAELPKVYWLKAFSSREIGNYRQKEKAIQEGQPTLLTDREIAGWMNRTFAGEELKEDVDAKLGTPFIRVGGQGREDAKEPILTVTMPFNLKVGPLPKAEVPLQFTAKPSYDGGETTWTISDVRMGHAKVPEHMAYRFVAEAVGAVVKTKPEAEKMWEKLGKYRRVIVRDNKIVLEAPVR